MTTTIPSVLKNAENFEITAFTPAKELRIEIKSDKTSLGKPVSAVIVFIVMLIAGTQPFYKAITDGLQSNETGFMLFAYGLIVVSILFFIFLLVRPLLKILRELSGKYLQLTSTHLEVKNQKGKRKYALNNLKSLRARLGNYTISSAASSGSSSGSVIIIEVQKLNSKTIELLKYKEYSTQVANALVTFIPDAFGDFLKNKIAE